MAEQDGTQPPGPGRREGHRGPPRGSQRADRGRPGERGRSGRGTDRGPRGREGRRDRDDAGNATYRVLTELSALEKAFSSGDFPKQKPPLEEIAKQLRPLRLRSIDQLDMNTRGRLLTTLLRVQRQKEPPPAEPAVKPSTQAEPAAPADDLAEPAADDSAPVEASAPVDPVLPIETQAAAQTEPPLQQPVASSASAASEGQPQPVARDEKREAYRDVMFLIGSIWRALADEERAAAAFEASGRKEERPPEKAAPTARPAAQSADWRDEARSLELQKKTRDAARTHERHHSYSEAARLFESGGDLKSALRCALEQKDEANARRLLKQLEPEAARPILEKEKAYELLMERYVESGDFENVARLYERARQYDQAAIAWERAGKLPQARKAFERVKDAAGAERIRQIEVDGLVSRGDRLGAALLLVGVGKREQAVATLEVLPPPKAFRFLQKAKLETEAIALGQREVARAEAENQPGARARWLELLGDLPAAAAAWEKADRKDKALALYMQLGNWPQAAATAESLNQREKAIELYQRAGDRVSADRVASLPATLAAAPTSPPPLEGPGEGR